MLDRYGKAGDYSLGRSAGKGLMMVSSSRGWEVERRQKQIKLGREQQRNVEP